MNFKNVMVVLCLLALARPASAQPSEAQFETQEGVGTELVDRDQPLEAAPVSLQTFGVGATSTGRDLGAGYHIGAGDRISVTVFGEPDLTGEYSVGANGAIAFALLGDVQVRDLSTEEIGSLLAARLQEGFLLEPRVSVAVLSYRPFYILGEVQRPGAYPYAPDLTVLAAVATAGGFTYRANKRRVFIKRMGEEEQRMTLDGNTRVSPGDTVRIAERLF